MEPIQSIRFGKIKKILKYPNVIDLRNIYEPDELKQLGFNYYSLGRNID